MESITVKLPVRAAKAAVDYLEGADSLPALVAGQRLREAVTLHDLVPALAKTDCPGCGGSGVRCCEFGADAQ